MSAINRCEFFFRDNCKLEPASKLLGFLRSKDRVKHVKCTNEGSTCRTYLKASVDGPIPINQHLKDQQKY